MAFWKDPVVEISSSRSSIDPRHTHRGVCILPVVDKIRVENRPSGYLALRIATTYDTRRYNYCCTVLSYVFLGRTTCLYYTEYRVMQCEIVLVVSVMTAGMDAERKEKSRRCSERNIDYTSSTCTVKIHASYTVYVLVHTCHYDVRSLICHVSPSFPPSGFKTGRNDSIRAAHPQVLKTRQKTSPVSYTHLTLPTICSV